MGKKLAIQGHTTRGNEVITLLEKLGGHADDLLDNGIDEKYAYFIVKDENNVIDAFPIDKKMSLILQLKFSLLKSSWRYIHLRLETKLWIDMVIRLL